MLGNMNLAAPMIGRTDAQNLLGLFGFGPRDFFDVGEDSRAAMDAAPPQVKFS